MILDAASLRSTGWASRWDAQGKLMPQPEPRGHWEEARLFCTEAPSPDQGSTTLWGTRCFTQVHRLNVDHAHDLPSQ